MKSSRVLVVLVSVAVGVSVISVIGGLNGLQRKEEVSPTMEGGNLPSSDKLESHDTVSGEIFHRSVDFGDGESRRSFEFNSPGGADNLTTISVVGPDEVAVGLYVITDDGTRLNALEPEAMTPEALALADGPCQGLDEGGTRCEIGWPTLEARGPGIWTAHLQKMSDAPAVIDVSFVFRACPGGRC